jgi:hypothetical protein
MWRDGIGLGSDDCRIIKLVYLSNYFFMGKRPLVFKRISFLNSQSINTLKNSKFVKVRFKLMETEEYEEIEPTDETSLEPQDITVPFDPKEINIAVEPKTIGQLVSRLEEGAIDLNTEFQRKGNLWDDEVMSRLIESILLRFPLPTFYFDAEEEDHWLVVDGLQRLSCLQKFIVEKKLKLKGLEILKNDYEGKNYDELTRTMQRRILETQVITYIIKPGTPKKVKYNVFRRINTGGLMLNPMEIRHALNQEGATISNQSPANYLQSISENAKFKNFVNVQDKRMQDRELILRYVAFTVFEYKKYTKPLSSFLDNAMEEIGKKSNEELLLIEKKFFQAVQTCYNLFGKAMFSKSIAFPNNKIMLNSALFEVWTSQLARLDVLQVRNLEIHRNELLQNYKNLFSKEAFENSVTRSTSDNASVQERFSKIEALINQFI